MSADDERLDEIWTAFAEGGRVVPDDAAALLARLEAEPARREACLDDAELDGLLRGLDSRRQGGDAFTEEVLVRLGAERDREPFVAATVGRLRASRAGEAGVPELPQGRRRAARAASASIVALGAAAAVIGAFQLGRRSMPAPPSTPGEVATTVAPVRKGLVVSPAAPDGNASGATVQAVDGTVLVIAGGRTDPAARGRELKSGEGLITVGAASAVKLRYADGTALELGGDAALPVVSTGGPQSGKSVLLTAGTVRALVSAQPPGSPFVLTTPHVEATVLGTRLQIAVTAQATRLEVQEGRVRLRRTGGDEVLVVAGQRALAAADGAALSVEQARARAPGGTAILVVGALSLSRADELVRDRLQSLGFAVKVRGSGLGVDAEVRGSAVVVMSSSIESVDATTPLREVAVPVVIWESALFDELGLTAAEEEGGARVSIGERGELVVKNPSHPLAAGLSGTVRVTNQPADMRWGTPGPFAIWIATLPGFPTRAGVFAYERHALLEGGLRAPARRVGLFLNDVIPQTLTDDGWALFDAAILWCAEGRSEP